MSDNLDGLTYSQALVLRDLIHNVIRRKCMCDEIGITCIRCRRVNEIRQHFPSNWAYAADDAARVGGSR